MIDTNELKHRVNLQDIVEREIGKPAKRARGINFYSCPFHGDGKTPSLAVYVDHFYCYGCSKSGDAIKWIQERRGLDFKQACSTLGAAKLPEGTKPVITHQPVIKEPPAEDWQDRAAEVMVECAATLWTGAGEKAIDWLHKRGLADFALRRWNIGYNHTDREINGLRIPRGIVIPHWQEDANTLWALQVRLPAGPHKYHQVAGSRLSLYMADTLKGYDIAFVVEGELDSILLWQHIRDQAAVITFGGVSNKDIISWLPYLLPLKRLLIATDTDQSGEQAAADWLERTKRARRTAPPITPPEGKDITDAWTRGHDIRSWALDMINTNQ